MLSLFFSYSHEDEASRNELEKHLAMLRRDGTISSWHDRRIRAGEDIHHVISERLDAADIILLLVSPDFLDSDYCYDVEMQRAVERHNAGEARVIPVILQPCDWLSAPFGHLRATPPDGKPIAKYPNVNDAYLAVAHDVRTAAADLLRAQGEPAKPPPTTVPPPLDSERIPQERSSNLRVKRLFSDKDRDDFLDEAFEYVARFFDNSLSELQTRNPGIEAKYRRIDTTHFEASVYMHGSCQARCGVSLARQTDFMPGLQYSPDPSRSVNSYTELLFIVDDGYSLGLTAQLRGFHAVPDQSHMTLDGAAEHLWSLFVNPLQ